MQVNTSGTNSEKAIYITKRVGETGISKSSNCGF